MSKLYPNMRKKNTQVKGSFRPGIKGDLTPGFKTGNKIGLKGKVSKPKVSYVKTKSVKIKRRV